jgi:hypothetical protein
MKVTQFSKEDDVARLTVQMNDQFHADFIFTPEEVIRNLYHYDQMVGTDVEYEEEIIAHLMPDGD